MQSSFSTATCPHWGTASCRSRDSIAKWVFHRLHFIVIYLTIGACTTSRSRLHGKARELSGTCKGQFHFFVQPSNAQFYHHVYASISVRQSWSSEVRCDRHSFLRVKDLQRVHWNTRFYLRSLNETLMEDPVLRTRMLTCTGMTMPMWIQKIWHICIIFQKAICDEMHCV